MQVDKVIIIRKNSHTADLMYLAGKKSGPSMKQMVDMI